METGAVLDLEVIDRPDAAAALLDPLRGRVLAAVREPGSATSVAAALGEPRQKINYHLRILEEHGLVELLEERPRRGVTERIMVATARSYAISPAAMGDTAVDPGRIERMSSRYLIAVAARMLDEVAALARAADRASKRLATLTIDTEIRFANAAERAAFTDELAAAVTSLVAKYHDEAAPRGRRHRLVVAAHPLPIHRKG